MEEINIVHTKSMTKKHLKFEQVIYQFLQNKSGREEFILKGY